MRDESADSVLTFYRRLWEQKASVPPQAQTRSHGATRTDVARGLLCSGERLLDVGCWGGDALERMNARPLFHALHGVDLLDSSVGAARARGIEAHVVDLNHQSLPYADDFFDAVTCLAVIAQVFDPAGTVIEMRRVLRPGGQLILSVPNVASLPNRARLLLGRRPRTSWDPGWDGGQLHYFNLVDTRGLLERCGFKVLSVHPVGRWAGLRRVWPTLLSRDLVFDARRLA